MNGAPEDGEESSRRRLLALLAAALLALVGTGTGVTNLFGGNDDENGVDLSVDYSVTPDESTATPTPTPSGGGGSNTDEATDPPERSETATETEGSDGETTTADTPWQFDDPDDDPRSASRSGTVTPGNDLVTTSIPPVSVSDVEPGDGGVVDLSLTLSGSPAQLWVRGAATDFDERGVAEAERSAGDTGDPGELQQHIEVRLWYDADSDEAASDGDTPVYEGSLADLDGLGDGDGWVSLTGACVPPGTHTARFRWELPVDAPNTVQTDAASFSLGIAADASACDRD